MITSRHINVFISVLLAVAVIFTGVLMFTPNAVGVYAASSQPQYAAKLFDKNSVMEIDILVDKDEWAEMLENATAEEYISCDITINGETFNTVGIRPKGNSSLTQVASDPNTDRFSFKLEFDHYVKGQTCYGLDKFVVNNIQSDNTYMKEYLAYDMMEYMDVPSSLYAYANIKVNGEDWGFYLAVEALEESYALRNFGSDYGMLYKPESMGNRGGGKMEEFLNQDDAGGEGNAQDNGDGGQAPGGMPPDMQNGQAGEAGEAAQPGNIGNDADTSGTASSGSGTPSGGAQPPTDGNQAGTPPDMNGQMGSPPDMNGGNMGQPPSGMPNKDGNGAPPDMAGGTADNANGGGTDSNDTASGTGNAGQNAGNADSSSSDTQQNQPSGAQGGPGGFGGMGGMGGPGGIDFSSGGSDLVYTDDEISSYSDIFDNAVFDSSDSDYSRVIEAIRNLNAGTDLETYINVDEVLRYFAVHTVLVNYDSYIGNLKHNYYLYEKDSQLSILPWDFNLAFGGFQSGSASSAINAPIDTPVADTTLEQRPLIGKLLEVPAYLEKYHEYLQQIVDEYFNGGIFTSTIDRVDQLIKAYVQNDATAFCTYEEYENSLPALKQFGILRSQSIAGQLSGSIPSTTDGQSADPSSLIDTASLNLSDLGVQGGGMGGGGFAGMNRQTGGGQDAGAQQFGNERNDSNTGQNGSAAEDTAGSGQGEPQGSQQNGELDNAQAGNPNDAPGDMQNGAPGGTQMFGDMENMPDREVMMQAMQILQSMTDGELTEEQTAQLKELGLDDEQIESLKNMAANVPVNMGGGQMGGSLPDNMQLPGNAAEPSGQNGFSLDSILVLAVSAAFLIAALLFAWFYRRRKYHL
ncbi:CotH kinase family protein [Candidatus Soleaferrea massiliensis]|uniref:CotH kinase family protein n=1 Tax=Candidatus Soleaferrea massiliensis TaxID=1470354 RepID=UPI0005914F84|nr:CotH kinase family protein [Candidatus Soleaferrea massiliensis]